MAESIKRRILGVLLTLAMIIGMMPSVALTAYGDATTSISLVANPNYVFDPATEGYGTQPPYSVRVQNTGTVDTGALDVTLSGDNADKYILSMASISNITVGNEQSISVAYKAGLAAGTYSATVTVSGTNVESKSFDISFTVKPAGTTYPAQIRTYIDGAPANMSGDITLHKDSSVIAIPNTGTGIYEAAIPNGSYFIYVNNVDTGRTLAVNDTNCNATLEYFTVNFSASKAGNAVTSKINASVGGVAISDGDKVMSGKTVAITASGTGAGSYTYKWSGSGTSEETTESLSIVISDIVNVACVVTGIGTPPQTPDYEINGAGYNWTSSDQVVVLSGADDKLILHEDPNANVRIEVQSEDDSTVTIEGNSIACDDMRIIVSNDISLVLKDVNITAPLNWPALLLQSDGSAGTMTVNIKGESTLTGTGYGCGIKSDHDQDIVITGDGVLNAIGGGNVSGTDGGAGIFSTALSKGTSLTIEGAVTINATGGSSLTHSGGSGIDVASGSILMKSGVVNVTSGVSYGTNYNSSHGIRASFPSNNHSIGGNIIIKGGTVKAVGGDAEKVSGGYGIYAFNKLSVEGGSVTVIGGNSVSSTGGAGALAYEQNLEVSGGSLNATGGNSESNYGGQAIYNFYKDIVISGGTVIAKGGQSVNKDGGRAIVAANLGIGNVQITGGNVTAIGGSGGINGAHAVYADKGTIRVENEATLTAKGGKGTTGMGGVGMRAAGNDGTILHGNTVTISNDAGDIYVRGGMGSSNRRASIMGKEIYIGTGNIGSVVMEGSNSRSIKNTVSGNDVYLVNAAVNPAAEVKINCLVSGSIPDYTYRAITEADGTASLWLPEGNRSLSSIGYTTTDVDVKNNDTQNSATLGMPSTVTAHDSTELQNYMAAAYVSTINLVSGTEYTYDGSKVTRLLTINGNGATINVGTGISDTIVKRVDPISGAVNSASGETFLAVEGVGSNLTMKNVKLHDEATRLLAAINVKTGGTLLLDGVTFDGFFANKEDDTYPNDSNIPGSFNNFGVHAEPGAISTTVKNCVFGSSNSFRNAVAIRNGIALITDNTFVGTANPNRQNQTDGFEYAVYLYGGNCTVTGNQISGYDSILKTNLGYHSAGIATCPFYDLTAIITGNTLHNNARGIDGVGSWHTYSYPTVAKINGTQLTTSANVFSIGQGLKGANTFTNNTDGNIALALDQNDNYTDSSTGIEYGPPAYCDTFLKAGSTTENSASLSFDTSAWAKSMIRNAKSFKIEVSEDNGATWKETSTTESINASSGAATVNLASGKTYLLRAALTITAKTRPYGSNSDVYEDILCYSNTVSQVIIPSSNPNSGHSGGSSNNSSSTTTNTVVEVNGQKQDAGLASIDKNGGKTITTVKVDDTKLDKILESKGSNATVTLPINTASDIVVGELNGQTVKNMEKKEATLEIKTEKVTYTLPASQINIDSVSKQIGTQVALKDIKVSITIAEPAAETVKAVENTANKNSYQIIVKPVEFAISCTSGGKTVDVSKFNGYVERIVAIPDGVDPSKITTGIVLNEDGTFRHVPTQVTLINGKYYAKINSLTNSTYSVIYNPMEFADVSNHWAKKEINNMGSRMVVTGVGNHEYDPDRSITRGEFAAILVRALGLAQGTGGSGFHDVEGSKWYNGYIKTASEYGIIKGYSDVQFGPNDKITREQAMTMIARAMEITGLKVELSKSEVGSLLTNYTDGAFASEYAKTNIEACLKAGIITGRSSNSIAPKEYITRAEIAAIAQRLLQKSNLINQ